MGILKVHCIGDECGLRCFYQGTERDKDTDGNRNATFGSRSLLSLAAVN